LLPVLSRHAHRNDTYYAASSSATGAIQYTCAQTNSEASSFQVSVDNPPMSSDDFTASWQPPSGAFAPVWIGNNTLNVLSQSPAPTLYPDQAYVVPTDDKLAVANTGVEPKTTADNPAWYDWVNAITNASPSAYLKATLGYGMAKSVGGSTRLLPYLLLLNPNTDLSIPTGANLVAVPPPYFTVGKLDATKPFVITNKAIYLSETEPV